MILLTFMSFQPCISLFFMLNTNYDISKNFEVPKSCWSPIDFHNKKEILWKSMGTNNCSITNILQNIFFCVQHKKENHTGLERHEGWVNDDKIFIFKVNYPFNTIKELKTFMIYSDHWWKRVNFSFIPNISSITRLKRVSPQGCQGTGVTWNSRPKPWQTCTPPTNPNTHSPLLQQTCLNASLHWNTSM